MPNEEDVMEVGPGVSGGGRMLDTGPGSAAVLGLIVILAAYKVVTDGKVLGFEPSEMKVSAHNIMVTGLSAVTFIVFLKLANAALLQRGVRIPGLPDVVAAI